MAVDGAVFDRPQIGPAYDDTPGGKYEQTSRDLYIQEHYLPITQSGGLEIVHSRDELVRAIRSAIEDPGRLAEGRKRLVREICTFDDGRATERVAHAVRSFIEQHVAAGHEVAKSA
jgi:CDP-glycerol glycerophosphotransferase (TagB/SpsB family)